MWGVKSRGGVITVAPKGEQQARDWADYRFKTTIGDVGEVLVQKWAKGWVVVE